MRPRGGFGIIKGLSRALCLFILLVAAAPLQAAGDQATIASNFLKFLGSDKKISSEEIVERSLLAPALAPVPVAHLFQLEGGGYILVSTERSISPVKAYSLAGDFSALPEPYRKAILDELELRVRVASLSPSGSVPQAVGSTETEARWDFLLRFDALRQPLSAYTPYIPGSNLIASHWAQDYPYNKFLPEAIPGQNVLAGCVNVATGQIMRYYKHPAAGKGVLSYNWVNQSAEPPATTTLKTILYRNYNWENMPDRLDAATPEYQTDEVALLMRDLGVANRTNFGINDSSAFFSPDTLVENFGYSTSLATMDNGTYEVFLEKIKTEIAAERPLLLGLPNHMAVIDGYGPDESGRKIHVNLGWGGSVDNFYFLDPPPPPPDPLPDGTIPNFGTNAGDLTIHYNIKPCSESAGDCYVNREEGDIASGLVITGSFDNATDKDDYEFYLKGETKFLAERLTYNNVGFYVSFIDAAEGREVFVLADPAAAIPNTEIRVGDLAPGKYRVRASLCYTVTEGEFIGSTSCYDPGDSVNQYKVTLISQELTVGEQAAAGKPPVIDSVFSDLILNTSPPEVRRILIDARDENGDAVALSVENSNPAAVGASLNGNILELTATETAKIASRIVVTALANGQSAQKSFLVMTDSGGTAFGKSFTINGTFANQSDVQISPVILDGDCQIQGDNGFTGQAFFSSVVDSSGVVIGSIDGGLGVDDKKGSVIDLKDLQSGIYSLKAAPCGPSFCYIYEDPPAVGWAFKFTVTCPTADVSPVTIAEILGIDLAGAYLPIIRAGDLNGDEVVNLADAILGLQLLSGMDMTGKTINLPADPDHTGKITAADVIFILQKAANLRLR